MKRIEFIAPVEAMRGNLSGKQYLVYAENDNKAYEAPVGRKNYARNYASRFIGAKISASGKKYFSVKTKTCTNLTTKAKMHMAVFGGAAAIVSAIMNNVAYKALKEHLLEFNYDYETRVLGYTGSFRQYLTSRIQEMLAAKAGFAKFKGALQANVRLIRNPWPVDGQAGIEIAISQGIIVKFWEELGSQASTFIIDGAKGLMIVDGSGQTSIWAAVTEGTDIPNILQLTTEEFTPTGGGDSKNFVEMGGRLVVDENGVFQYDEMQIINHGVYHTSDAISPYQA